MDVFIRHKNTLPDHASSYTQNTRTHRIEVCRQRDNCATTPGLWCVPLVAECEALANEWCQSIVTKLRRDAHRRKIPQTGYRNISLTQETWIQETRPLTFCGRRMQHSTHSRFRPGTQDNGGIRGGPKPPAPPNLPPPLLPLHGARVDSVYEHVMA